MGVPKTVLVTKQETQNYTIYNTKMITFNKTIWLNRTEIKLGWRYTMQNDTRKGKYCKSDLDMKRNITTDTVIYANNSKVRPSSNWFTRTTVHKDHWRNSTYRDEKMLWINTTSSNGTFDKGKWNWTKTMQTRAETTKWSGNGTLLKGVKI